MKTIVKNVLLLLASVTLMGLAPAYAQDRPNIVLVFMDNFGWGEPGFNGGGIIRGAADAADRYPGLRGPAPDQLQRRNAVHAVAGGDHVRPLRRSAAATPRSHSVEGFTASPSGKSRWPRCCPMPDTPRACSASGTWVTPRAGSRPTRASTSGTASRTRATRRPGNCSTATRRAASRGLTSSRARKALRRKR